MSLGTLADLSIRGTATNGKTVATQSFTPTLNQIITLWTHAEMTAAAETPVDPVITGTGGITVSVLKQSYNTADIVGTTRRANSMIAVIVTAVSGSGTIQASYAAQTNNNANMAIEAIDMPGAHTTQPVPTGQATVTAANPASAANSGTSCDLANAPAATSATLFGFHAPQSATTLGFGTGISTLISQKTCGNGVYIIGVKQVAGQQAAQGTMSPNRGDWGGITWEIAEEPAVLPPSAAAPWQQQDEWRESVSGGAGANPATILRGEFG